MIAVLLVTMLAFDDHGYGSVDPVPLPDISVTRHDGAVVRLRDLTAGKRTAVQFIFTSCPTACPLLGSLFSKVQKTAQPGPVGLLSISVDPDRDTPQRLAEWLRQFRGRRFRLGGGAARAEGEAIYERAQAVVAKVNGETVMAGAARCANCHGDLGEGRREGVLVAVPLQRSALMQSHSRRGGPPSAYGRASFCRSLRSGVDPRSAGRRHAALRFKRSVPRFALELRHWPLRYTIILRAQVP